MSPIPGHRDHDHDREGMQRALALLAAQVDEPDLAATTWRRGRRVRRHRQLAQAVGAVAALAVVAAGWSALNGPPGASPAGQVERVSGSVHAERTPDPSAHQPERSAPTTGDDDEEMTTPSPELLEVEAQARWARLWVACLEATSTRCDTDLLHVLPAWASELERRHTTQLAQEVQHAAMASPDGHVEESEVALDGLTFGPVERVYDAYARTATCLTDNGFPAWIPDEPIDFFIGYIAVNGLPIAAEQEFLPPWHPYEEVLARDGTIEVAMQVCPVGDQLSDP